MSITRGKFLQQLGKSLPGMILGSGAAAAQSVLSRMAAASGGPAVPVAARQPRPPAKKPGGFIRRGAGLRSEIALTFDDGPTPGVTDRILDELKARGVHATFFMIGESIAKAPELARRVLAEGHDAGNHSFTHPKLSEMPDAQVAAELERTRDVMAKEMTCTTGWFRPPFGAFRPDQAALTDRLGLRVVLWSIDPSDWAQPGEEQISATILDEAEPGGIVLCHDRHAQTANCIGAILDALLARGLRPVTLSQLLAP